MVRGVRARSARILNIFHFFMFLSCYSNYQEYHSYHSLTHTARKSPENQYSNAHSILTNTKLALRARTQVRHCSRCTERCNEIAKTFGTKEEIEAANDVDLVLCAGKCGRGFHRQCLQDHEIFQVAEEAMWRCMDCRTNVHECFVCGVKGLLRGHEEIKIGNEIEEMAEEKIRRRSRRREKRKKVERKIAFVRSLDNETPRQISRKLKIDLKTLVAMNRLKYPGLHANARLMQDTELELPHRFEWVLDGTLRCRTMQYLWSFLSSILFEFTR